MNQPYWKESEEMESQLRQASPDNGFRPSGDFVVSQDTSSGQSTSGVTSQHQPPLPPPPTSHISTSAADHVSSSNITTSSVSGPSTGTNAHVTSPDLGNRPVEGSPNGNGVDDLGGIKKPVSTTKRAVQNRNAQRAFRQRKEKYVKELEARVAEMSSLHKKIDDLQRENRELRDYTMALQSELLKLTHNMNNESKE